MSWVPPCRRPGADPDDWFIESNGKQYPEDELLTESDVQGIVEAVAASNPDATEEDYDRAIRRAERDALTAALGRRRRAKDACWNDCIPRIRLGVCLEVGMEPTNINHGIFGGYDPKERRAIEAGGGKDRLVEPDRS